MQNRWKRTGEGSGERREERKGREAKVVKKRS